MVIYTIGHSTRTLDELLAILMEFEIAQLVDVRTIPRSRRNPQFNKETLPANLTQSGIKYVHMGELGGLRKPLPDSVNKAWENDSFRGYADYMQTAAFEEGLTRLIQIAKDLKTAIMCAEAVPWRCHRSLIGDALLVRNIEVMDILGPGKSQPHKISGFARVEGEKITYPTLV